MRARFSPDAEVVVLDPAQLGALVRGEQPGDRGLARLVAVALEEAEQVRVDEQQPLHHDHARHALEARGGLEAEDVRVVQQVGDLVVGVGDPVGDAVQPVLDLARAAEAAALRASRAA